MPNKKLYASMLVSNDGTFLSMDVKEMYLEYYVVEDEVIDKNEGCRRKSYGIELVKREITRDNTVFLENVVINDISSSQIYVQELIEKVANHTVTPVTLKEVLSDIVGVYHNDQSREKVSVA